MNQNTLPIWSGKAKELPAKGVEFLYNGRRYVWHPCNCRPECQRPDVFDVETNQQSEELTIRARGFNQGNPVEDVLLKSGAVSMDALAGASGNILKYAIVIHDGLIAFDEMFEKQGLYVLIKNNISNQMYVAFMMMRP